MVERSKCMNVPEIRFKEFCDYYSDILLEKCLSLIPQHYYKIFFLST